MCPGICPGASKRYSEPSENRSRPLEKAPMVETGAEWNVAEGDV
ncbi:metallo-beta-lactamase superfamily protein [Moniliophthora roreri]|nr:metallo-beta-lactamase superfamily protein [Moniliophthora roreri]